LIRYNKNSTAIGRVLQGVMPKLVAIKNHISVQQLEQRYRYASCCNRANSLSCHL